MRKPLEIFLRVIHVVNRIDLELHHAIEYCKMKFDSVDWHRVVELWNKNNLLHYGGWIEGRDPVLVLVLLCGRHHHQPSPLADGSVSRFNCRNTNNGFM